ncbi:TonB-dependent receptor [Ideonella sp. DXS29W]|uniref:TonB-dependent receptor n=1 Tax=Ideonella lacteola TaxID=2984193 RepID=A0ABU9BJK1_9BURK
MSSLRSRHCAALALACAMPTLTSAQTTTAVIAADAATGDRVVVTGAREPTAADRLAGDLVLIDSDQIRQSTADSVEDLLRRHAGVQVSRNGGPGASAGIFIRGSNVGNVLVLVDGVRVGSATLGQVEFEGLSLGAIDHIEVLRGPGSSLYGADGTGGVVQIFTRRGEGAPQGLLSIAGGSYGAAEASVSAQGRFGDIDAAASYSHEQLDGVSSLGPGDRFGNYNPDRDGMRRDTATAQIGWRPLTGHRVGVSVLTSQLDSRYDSAEYPPPDYAPDPSPDFHGKLDNHSAALDYHGTWGTAWTGGARLSTQESDLHSGGNDIDRYRTRRQQLDLQATWRPAPEHSLTLAYEGLTEKAVSSAFGEEKQRDNDALVLAYLGSLGPVQTQLDLRRDQNSDYDEVTTGRIGGSISVAPGWRVRALAGTSFRAPSFNDLYYPGYGVPPGNGAFSIQPERGRSVELGVEGRGEGYDLSFTVYQNRLRDMIGYQPDRTQCPADPAYDFGCAANVSKARLQGATLGAGAQWREWQFRAGVDVVDAKNTDTGERLNRRAAHQFTLSADYTSGEWRFGASVLQVGARPDGTDGYTLPQETTLDLKARWQFAPGWAMDAKVLNATDVDREPAREYQALGRQVWIGVSYAFGVR